MFFICVLIGEKSVNKMAYLSGFITLFWWVECGKSCDDFADVAVIFCFATFVGLEVRVLRFMAVSPLTKLDCKRLYGVFRG